MYENGCEYLFNSDDDVKFIAPDWWQQYIHASMTTGIKMLSATFSVKCEPKTIKQIKVKICPKKIGADGYMIFFHRSVVDVMGYMKLLPHKYGGEHCEYQRRIITYHPHLCNEFYDLENSTDLLIHQDATEKSTHNSYIKKEEFDLNILHAKPTVRFVDFSETAPLPVPPALHPPIRRNRR